MNFENRFSIVKIVVEEIYENSWIMRQLWDTKKGYYHQRTIKNPEKLKSSGTKRLVEDALWTQGIRKNLLILNLLLEKKDRTRKVRIPYLKETILI